MPAEEAPHSEHSASVTLLGPQRQPRVDAVLESLQLRGARAAVINAGWREREPEDELLMSLTSGNAVNLRLWHRMQEVWEADPEFAAADQQRRMLLEEMQDLYVIALDHVVDALRTMAERVPRSIQVQRVALGDAQQIMREIDERHLARVNEIHADFWERWPPHERRAVQLLRQLISKDLADAEVVLIPGGHVGVLVGALHLFNIAPQLQVPIVAWGAGAMALTDRVVLFHDRAAHGPSVSEIFTQGLGLVRNTVALPGARERLDLGNPARMGVLARRLAPARCLLLDARVRVDILPGGELPEDAPVLADDGAVTTLGQVR
ncbi:hypothetical protein MWU75_14975 [Ornithinimicrobium sp. F0845]|uniref:hypothetical protein n=1 Tax=Ornithinimicrobium sp. F0845 TaxID=2926412 RepID=UPI001FF64C9E|nr:hypothetical protein [Ornithinimicrobium sp. F0845]MCK0113450.1 hypothetical protein [Ornithinimicrobium sp. F0845]